MSARPDSASLAASVIVTGAADQAVVQGPPSQATVVVGGGASARTVKLAGSETVPAPFVTVTASASGSAAPAVHVYAPPVRVQPAPRSGYCVEATPEAPPSAVAVTMK